MTKAPSATALFHVQHLYGVGHAFRAKWICDELIARGFNVVIGFGGMPLPELDYGAAEVHHLPPLRATSSDYSEIVTADGHPVTEPYLAYRKRQIVDICRNATPDVILTEAFPFGRRLLRDEMLALIGTGRGQKPRVLVACSVRDILQENRKPGRAEEAVELVNSYYDLILVHADPNIVRFDQTFPLADQISDKICYTGMVARARESPVPTEAWDVVVSAGGGAFGETILHRAVQAASREPLARYRWLVIAGRNSNPGFLKELEVMAPPHVQIVRHLDNFPNVLRNARLSISQAGYNTVTDILAARCRAVLVPSDAGGQTEQARRAGLIADAGLAVSLPESQLTVDRLVAAAERALQSPQPVSDIALDGARESIRLIETAIAEGATAMSSAAAAKA